MEIDTTYYKPHTFEVAESASGRVCTAMQVSSDVWSGDQCGLPPDHYIHGVHVEGTPLNGRYFRRQVDTKVFHDDIIKALNQGGVVYHVTSLTRETNYDTGVSTVWLQVEIEETT